MKKFGLASLVFMLCLSCSIAFTPINVSAASVNVKPYDTTIETNIVLNHEDEVELAGFMKMQDEITNTLSLKDGKYIYNEEKIREIVYEYDFNAYNKKYNTSWTKQSFFNSAMKNIRDFKDVKNLMEHVKLKHVVLHVQQCVVRIGNHQDGIMCE